jgi:hypothetical protein
MTCAAPHPGRCVRPPSWSRRGTHHTSVSASRRRRGGVAAVRRRLLRDGHVGADRWSILVRYEPGERVGLSDRHPPAGPHVLSPSTAGRCELVERVLHALAGNVAPEWSLYLRAGHPVRAVDQRRVDPLGKRVTQLGAHVRGGQTAARRPPDPSRPTAVRAMRLAPAGQRPAVGQTSLALRGWAVMLANTLASSGASGGDCLADLRAVRWLPNACCPDAYGRCVSGSDINQALAAKEGRGGRRAGSWYSSPQSRVSPGAQIRTEATVHSDARRRESARCFRREAVGISVLSGGFKTLLAWLENSLELTVVSCC